MSPILAQACLAEIRQIWLGAREDSVWIAAHAPVGPETIDPDTSVINAWIMDIYGIERRSADDFVRFMTVQSGRHWSTGMSALAHTGVFNDRPGRMHTIGLAAFAAIQDTELIYLHYIWGGTTARGSKYPFDRKNATLECVQDIWIS